jgi:hypothetical protein
MAGLQELQDQLKRDIDGFFSCAVIDAVQGIPLATAEVDPSFDQTVPCGFFTMVFQSSLKAFEASGWGKPKEVLILGDTYTVLLISLKEGRYYQGISVANKTPLGMIRAVYGKVQAEIEKNCP